MDKYSQAVHAAFEMGDNDGAAIALLADGDREAAIAAAETAKTRRQVRRNTTRWAQEWVDIHIL